MKITSQPEHNYLAFLLLFHSSKSEFDEIFFQPYPLITSQYIDDVKGQTMYISYRKTRDCNTLSPIRQRSEGGGACPSHGIVKVRSNSSNSHLQQIWRKGKKHFSPRSHPPSQDAMARRRGHRELFFPLPGHQPAFKSHSREAGRRRQTKTICPPSVEKIFMLITKIVFKVMILSVKQYVMPSRRVPKG